MALLTRSRLSRIVESGKPTMLKAGSPAVTSTSTDTSAASIPVTAAESTRASMAWIVWRGVERVNVQNRIHQSPEVDPGR